jgi:hypothetical protein
MRTIAILPILLAFKVSLLASPAAAADSPTLIVHEWGTFTSFQDSIGATIAGINVDDEPVPKFVHRLHERPVFTTRSMPALWSQGAPRCHRDVTLRLETPVLYFYPQPAFSGDAFDVRAAFVGGWLTEFYPFAEAANSGFPGELRRDTQGALHWTRLRLAEDSRRIPATTARVWLAPRAVASAVVTEGRKQEAEKYLFYRGVGRIDAPVVVRGQGGALDISLRDAELSRLPPMWLVRVRPDGRVRFTRVKAGEGRTVNITVPGDEASPSEFSALRRELAEALLAEGLYREEAQAMLDTWQLSYFESEGTRLFFVLPRAWTDARLPLSISVPSEITRVMLGRIELVSSHQRQALNRLYELPSTAFALTPIYAQSSLAQNALRAGTTSHADLYRSEGRDVPEALRLYDSLGRFRDALLAHEWQTSRDSAKRMRLQKVMQLFSACTADLDAPQPTPVRNSQ